MSSDLKKNISEVSEYILCHNKHYKCIFQEYINSKYSKYKDCDEVFTLFIKTFVMIQDYFCGKECKINKIMSALKMQNCIFETITKKLYLTSHYKLDATTILVYITLFKNYFSTCDDTTPYNNGSDTTSNNKFYNKYKKICTSSEYSCTTNPSVNTLSTRLDKCDSSSSASSLPSCDNFTINHTTYNTSSCSTTCTSSSQPLKKPMKKCSIKVDEVTKILQKHHNKSIWVRNVMCDIAEILEILESMFANLLTDYVKQLNNYSLNDVEAIVNFTDVEQQNRILNTTYNQIKVLLKDSERLGVFNGCKDDYKITICNGDDIIFILCVIDNFKISNDDCNVEFDIGIKGHDIYYISETSTYSFAKSCIKGNINVIKDILQGLCVNKTCLYKWIEIINNI
jgi:hypothetical protein